MRLTANDLICALKEHKDWIEANSLAEYFGVTTRSIRKHIKDINIEYPNYILSSYKGYKINSSDYDENVSEDSNETNYRTNYILRKLITSTEPLSVYGLADELHISDSSFERSLKNVKTELDSFDLKILRKRNHIEIEGKERKKRKLINYLISKENNDGYFTSSGVADGLVTANIDLDSLKSHLSAILANYNVYMNDYGFQTVMFHIAIMIDRVLQGKYVVSDDINSGSVTEDSTPNKIVNDIKDIIEKKYKISLPHIELYYLSIIVSNNCNNFELYSIDSTNISSFIEKEYIDLVQKIAKDLEVNYCLEPFTEKFIVNLTVHIRNLIVRVQNETYTQNPLTTKFQNQYPLIFDMATFIAKEIYDYMGIKIVDDEIAFIAFHIGSYIENKKIQKEQIRVCYVYNDYHDFYLNSIKKISEAFEPEIYISSIVSIKNINLLNIDDDLIITTDPFQTSIPCIEVSMFITNEDLANIRIEIDHIKAQRKKDNLRKDLNHFIGEKLFKKEFYCENNIEMIEALSKECIRIGLCDRSFTDEVLERENMSFTSFSNNVAIPHSLKANTKHSFMSIVINKKKMQWGRNQVNVIILIGTSSSDREKFKNIYDELVQVLYEPANVRVLVKCNDYDEFLTKLVNLIS